MHAIANVSAGERILTEALYNRLEQLGGLQPQPAIAEILDSSDVVGPGELPADVVGIDCEVELRQVDTGERRTLQLCWPQDADPALNKVSVLSPAGLALLGRREGATARWSVAGGPEQAVVIERVNRPG